MDALVNPRVAGREQRILPNDDRISRLFIGKKNCAFIVSVPTTLADYNILYYVND